MTDEIVRCRLCLKTEYYNNRAIHLSHDHDIDVLDVGMKYPAEIELVTYESPELDRYFVGVLK